MDDKKGARYASTSMDRDRLIGRRCRSLCTCRVARSSEFTIWPCNRVARNPSCAIRTVISRASRWFVVLMLVAADIFVTIGTNGPALDVARPR